MLFLLACAPTVQDTCAPLPVATERDAVDWPFTTTSPWNLPRGDSATFGDGPCTQDLRDTSFPAWINAAEWSHPIALADAGDAEVEVWDDGELRATFRAPTDATPSVPPLPDGDAHLHVIDPEGRYVDELWKADVTDSVTWEVDAHARIDLYGEGVASGGVRVYGGSAIAGLIRPHEVDHIPHALSLSLPMELLAQGWVWPATTESQRAPDEYLGQVPTGQFVAIPSDVDLGVLGLSDAGLAVGRALQDYGAYVTDHAGSWALYASPEADEAIDPARDDIDLLRSLTACVTDAREDAVGGPGHRRAALAPELPAP